MGTLTSWNPLGHSRPGNGIALPLPLRNCILLRETEIKERVTLCCFCVHEYYWCLVMGEVHFLWYSIKCFEIVIWKKKSYRKRRWISFSIETITVKISNKGNKNQWRK
jgi:hypothetical protein